ncbi:hypothetical protein SBA2_10106 [Acidobacteriia bacterium SbA2]|nr:hypothetical protein SBA2_10106 [Acidobacteriia bacterium SbA2]
MQSAFQIGNRIQSYDLSSESSSFLAPRVVNGIPKKVFIYRKLERYIIPIIAISVLAEFPDG